MLPPIPTLIVITDRHSAARAGRDLPTTVSAALGGGAPAVLLRDKDLPRDQRRELAEHLRERTATHSARLFVSSDAHLARQVGADGVHLGASDPPLLSRPPPPSGPPLPSGPPPPGGPPVPGGPGGFVVGRSCHDHVEVAAARDEGVSYAFASPVAASATKPGYGPALGPAGLRELVRAAGELPVLALGGVTPDNASDWRGSGAAGIAVMGGVMAATDPTAMVRRLLAAWDEA